MERSAFPSRDDTGIRQEVFKESCGLISLSTCSCDNFYSCLNINKSSYQV